LLAKCLLSSIVLFKEVPEMIQQQVLMQMYGLLGSILLFGFVGILPASAQSAAATNQITQTLPAPPSTPLPRNRTRSGGSLSDSTACGNTTETLIALAPVENPVLTTTDYPTFLIYVPYEATAIESGEFSILVGRNEATRLYRARFTLPDKPGIVSLQLPQLPAHALAEGTPYHWYFKLYCAGNTSAKADLEVDGWVQRVEQTPERDRQINAGTPEIWYDAIATLAARRAATPQDPTLQTLWQQLLTSIDAGDLASTPIAGAVTFESP
jgi:hypothetical protein